MATQTPFPRILEGRSGIITGGVGGLGRAMSMLFAKAGARVAVLDLDQAEAQLCAEEIGGGAIGCAVNIADEISVASAFARVSNEFGSLDFLVNNAGIRYERAFLEHSVQEWRQTLEVNLTGTFLCAQAAARIMVKRGRGKIVNVASIAGECAVTRRPAYVASKAGVAGLTRAIAWELGRQGIHCNAVAPGIVETALTAHFFEDSERTSVICNSTALGRWGQPGDIAGPAAFLCSDLSDFIQGTTVIVDGGWLAGKGY